MENSNVKLINSKDLLLISETCINCAMIFIEWQLKMKNALFNVGKIKRSFPCNNEVIRSLNRFDDNTDKLDPGRFVRIMNGFYNGVYSDKHAMLYRLGFLLAKQTLIVESFPEKVAYDLSQLSLSESFSPEKINSIQRLLDMRANGDDVALNNLDSFLVRVFEAVC